jgi:hypothetical protein
VRDEHGGAGAAKAKSMSIENVPHDIVTFDFCPATASR